MKNITKITEYVYRLAIPFMDVYTTVFVIKTPKGAVLFDTATYPEDVEEYIIPALEKLEISAEMLKYVVISHNHSDHSGGLERIMEAYPDTCIVARSKALQEKYSHCRFLVPEDGNVILDALRIATIPGHSSDCIGLIETGTGTLLSGDCLQMYGLFGSGKWGTNISMPLEHLAAIEKLRTMHLKAVAASHDYHPYGYLAQGEKEIGQYLEACVEALCEIKKRICENPSLSDEELAEIYNSSGKLPTVGAHVFAAIRETWGMLTDIKWIFFDVGTTLIDETEAYNHRIRDAIKDTDITFEQFQEKRIFFAKQNLKGDLEAIKYFGLKKTPWYKEDEVPYSDAEDILQYLREQGYKIGIIANQSAGTAGRLDKWGLLKYIDVVASSAELGVQKPDKAIFEKAFEMAHCTATEAVMVGDRLDNDIRPARELGMKAIWIKQGFAVYQNPENAGCEPDYIVNNLSELKNIF